MPAKTKRPKAQIAPEPRKSPGELIEQMPGVPVYLPLDMEERDRLSAILSDPVFVKAWNNARSMKPSAFPSDNEKYEGQWGDNRAAKQLARIQGWELHEAALIKQTREPASKPRSAPAEYPPSGSLEAEVARNLSTAQPKST